MNVSRGTFQGRVAVVGAGAFGGWTALRLARLGAEVILVDAWGPGNPRSSSGGDTRVIRAIYGSDRIYVEMVKRAYELWDELDHDLYVETGALWLDRDANGYAHASVPLVRELGFCVDELSVSEAAKRYPQIDFRGVRSVYFEHRAGALFARRACAVVRDEVVKAGGTYKTGTLDFEADAVVFAAGPWLGELLPDVIGNAITPTRQEIYYFETPRGSQLFAPPRMPIWLDFGERVFYGIPDIDGRGFKVADDTRGEPIDPNTMERVPSAEGIERARRFLAQRFPELANAALLSAEVCQYENSPDGNLIVDRHPEKKNVWIAGGGSGHGFKLAPALGEMVAEAIVNGAALPEEFSLARLGRAKARRQFEAT